MGNKSRDIQKEFSTKFGYEVKQQILDIIGIIIIFFVAMFCGKICMERYDETWTAFNIPAFGIAVIGLCVGYCLRKICVTRKNKEKASGRI